jgi:hypothetical protein
VWNSETSESEPLPKHRKGHLVTSKPGFVLWSGMNPAENLLTGWVVSGVKVA